MENSRGSEWRRWDLHVHTASSYDYKYKQDDADDKLIEVLRNNQIKAVAITDHFVIDKDRIQSLRNKATDIVFFPATELRTDKGDTNIHIILLFDNKSDLDTLSNDFNAFKRQYGKEINNNERIYWDFNDILDFAKRHNALISIHAGRKENGVDTRITNALQHNQAVKEEIANQIDIFEMGQPRDLDDYKQHVFPNIGRKPMIICSDNHNPTEYNFNSLWIKSDLTFDGLKQILYEPEERVKIQEDNPALAFDKSPFTEITFNNQVQLFSGDKDIVFERETLPLNSGLVSIIGGRGTRKSRLIDYVATGLRKSNNMNPTYNWTNDVIIKRKISLTEDDKEYSLSENNSIPFLYIKQGEVKDIVEDKTKFSEKIRELIGIPPEYCISDKNRTQANEWISDYSTIIDSLYDDIDADHKIETLDADIKKYKDFISNVSSKENKTKLENYQKATTELYHLKHLEEVANNLVAKIHNYQQELNVDIDSLHDECEVDIPHIDNQRVITYINDTVKLKLQKQQEEQNAIITSIKNQFSNYKGDLASLLDNIQNYQGHVNQLITQKDSIEKQRNRLNELTNKLLVQLGTEIESDINQYKETIINQWNTFISGKSDYTKEQKKLLNTILGGESEKIDLSVKTEMDMDVFYDSILESLDKRTWKKNHLKESTCIHDVNDYFSFIKKPFNINTLGADSVQVTKQLLKVLYSKYTDYIHHDIIITSNGKPLPKLSVGQRGTLYLRLQLASQLFSETIIYDQPEDDLDNEFITQSLVKLFKDIKKYRQVIIVSHNANLVVNADSEQIIVARNDNGTLSYKSGSLENVEINREICRILEGGKEAFEKREKKYGFQ